ncbi:Uncharacterised protein [Actinobacillus pleuropneumoniae]|nr:Uncharacterised protein [Actinobacillus pleuropneumoniae]
MNHRHLHAQADQSLGSFQTQQPSADDGRFLVCLGGLKHLRAVGDVSKSDNSLFITARYRQYKRFRTCSYNHSVIRNRQSVIGGHNLAFPVDGGNGHTRMQGDLIVLVPFPVIQYNVVQGFAAFQHIRQHNAIVVRVRLLSNDGDVKFPTQFNDLLDRANACDTVANDNQLFSLYIGHRLIPPQHVIWCSCFHLLTSKLYRVKTYIFVIYFTLILKI